MRGVGLAGLALAAASPAGAAELFAGVASNHLGIVSDCCYERGADIQFGLRSAPWARLLTAEVRGHLLGSVNTAGGVDYAAAGVTLRFGLPLTGLYVAPGIGVAVHDGPGARYQRTPDRLYFGSRVLFEPEISLGYHVAGPLAVELAYVHLSHAQLAGRQNPGIDNLGVRAVVRF